MDYAGVGHTSVSNHKPRSPGAILTMNRPGLLISGPQLLLTLLFLLEKFPL
jgi:hypothetical protein